MQSRKESRDFRYTCEAAFSRHLPAHEFHEHAFEIFFLVQVRKRFFGNRDTEKITKWTPSLRNIVHEQLIGGHIGFHVCDVFVKDLLSVCFVCEFSLEVRGEDSSLREFDALDYGSKPRIDDQLRHHRYFFPNRLWPRLPDSAVNTRIPVFKRSYGKDYFCVGISLHVFFIPWVSGKVYRCLIAIIKIVPVSSARVFQC